MALKNILYMTLLVLMLAGAEYFTWNLIITKFPITGITIENISFSLALQLSIALVIIQLIGKFGLETLNKIFN